MLPGKKPATHPLPQKKNNNGKPHLETPKNHWAQNLCLLHLQQRRPQLPELRPVAPRRGGARGARHGRWLPVGRVGLPVGWGGVAWCGWQKRWVDFQIQDLPYVFEGTTLNNIFLEYVDKVRHLCDHHIAGKLPSYSGFVGRR